MRVKKMSSKNRFLAGLLAVVMIVGLLPTAIFATDETVLDAAIFCSDVHGSTSDLTSVLGGVKTSGVDYSSIGFVGDTCLTVANTTSTVQSALGDTDIDVMFSYASSHDKENSADIATDWDYSGEVKGVSDHYLVYTIRETDMQTASAAKTAAAAFTTWAETADTSKPLFIISHRPMHERREGCDGGNEWYQAIQPVAKKMDVVFFWGHNHTGENAVDTAAYYVEKNGTESMTITNGETVVPNFTYMNAGYINANGQNPARKGIATTVQITADSLIFQDYNSSGAYSGTYAHNVTVAREFAAKATLSSISVDGTTSYTVGDELNLTVTANYDDDTTAVVTADATFTGCDLTASGKYTVTASYGGMTDTIDVTVNLYDEVLAADGETLLVAVEAFSQGATALEVSWDDAADAVLYEKGLYSDYVVYDLALTNYTAGTETEYSMSLVEDMDTANLAVYHVAEDETLTAVPFVIEGDCVVFTTTLTGTFAYGAIAVPEGYVLDSIAVSNAPADFFVGDSLDLTGDFTVTVIYKKDGAEDFTRVILPYEENNNPDGYTIDQTSFNMTTAGTYDVKIEYGSVYTTFPVSVWGETFTASDVTIKVGEGEYGVKELTIGESANEHIFTAITDVIKGENYVAYDISLTYEDGYSATETQKTVTLPIPEGVTNPVVYYVSDDGKTVTNMNAAKGDGVVTFETTHFSTYVVGESTVITVPDPETASGTGTGAKKTVYVLTDSISSGNSYLIVNGNAAGGYYALANNSGSVAATGVTVKTDSTIGTYIELDDATDELWTVSGSNSTTLANSGNYLVTWNGLSLSGSSDWATTWSYSNNSLFYQQWANYQRVPYYLTYENGWNVSDDSSNVYFYEPTEIDSATSGTYSIAGTPAEVTKVVTAGDTVTLGSTLTFTPESGDATTTDNPTGVTYTVVEAGDPNGVISGISGNTVTFSGKTGKALVKVSYTTDFGEVTNYIIVNASEPYYTLDVTKNNTVVSGTTVPIKGVADTTTLQLGTKITYTTDDGTETLTELPEGATLEWNIPEEYQNIATVDQNGLVTFEGVDGAFYVTVTLTVNGKDYMAGVNISATTSQYMTPTDGTDDFPEYPNEGAIRYDKTATAVGNFSETGITQIELSMTGVPYTTGSEIDVVLMLDMTGSMTTDSMAAAEAAALAFAQQIILNTDGTYNSNRISVQVFNKNGVTELWAMNAVTEDTYNSLVTAIESASTKQASGGTPYSTALSGCKDILDAARTDGVGNNRQQFCVFVSDGTPTSYTDVDGGSDTTKQEYYSSQMQEDGVTVYGVYTSAAAGSTGSGGGSVNDTEQGVAIMQNVASSDDKVYVVDDYTDTSALTGVFTEIAQDILQAATDVTVGDQISDDYTMIFDIPEGSQDITGVTNDFYIEFVKYTLDENHERTDSGTSVTKLYLKNTNGVYSAAKDSSGNAYDAPVFEAKTIGEKGTLYYWTTDSSYASDAAVTYTVDGTSYYFIPGGIKATDEGFNADKWFNMTSGGYAYGTVDSETNMSNNLVIATPYFVYNAGTKMLYWTVDKLDTTEYALRYFLYLDNSATEVGTSEEVDPGAYETNTIAWITYTNFKGNECRQEFPVPQMTWSGAQVSYVFYLVNAAGQPINKSGQIVDFANATFVTDVFTTSVVWNKGVDGQIEGDANLSVDWLANSLLPDDYLLYDVEAGYELKVYADSTGEAIFNYFVIEGADADSISTSLNNRLNLNTTTASVTTTKVYNTKAGTKYSAYGTYTSKDATNITGETILSDFDFANTTVAFAVVWQPTLVPDTVVVDFGLDVLVNVVDNDFLQNPVTGIGQGKDAYGDIAMNTGVSTTSKLGTNDLELNGLTISLENQTSIRIHQNNMQFSAPVTFYYESPVEFYEDSDKQEGFMYSSVTVVPATTIYYEDSFVTYKGDWSADQNTSDTQDQDRPGEKRVSADLDANNVYGYDSAYLDCTTYSQVGNHKATVSTSTYETKGAWPYAAFTFTGSAFDVISMTSGDTGFITVDVYEGDVLNDDGTIAANANKLYYWAVDTYYGYSYAKDGYLKHTWEKGADEKWRLTTTETVAFAKGDDGNSIIALPENTVDGTISYTYEYNWQVVEDPAPLYQIPVIKSGDNLTYGTYTVVITPMYSKYLDHNAADASYDFYLDAIRIYNPAEGNTAAESVYVQDKEGWPYYFEIRNNLLSVSDFDIADSATGVVFVDGLGDTTLISDYSNFGPNNEVYLSAGQGITFQMKAPAGIVADTQIGVKALNGAEAAVEVSTIGGTKVKEISTSSNTDLYYSINDCVTWNNGVSQAVLIVNTGDNLVSLTNIKTTFTADPTPDAQTVNQEETTDETGNEPAVVFFMEQETALEAAAYATARYMSASVTEDIPEVEEPETEEPEVQDPVVPEKPSAPSKPSYSHSSSKPNKPDMDWKNPWLTWMEEFMQYWMNLGLVRN